MGKGHNAVAILRVSRAEDEGFEIKGWESFRNGKERQGVCNTIWEAGGDVGGQNVGREEGGIECNGMSDVWGK